MSARFADRVMADEVALQIVEFGAVAVAMGLGLTTTSNKKGVPSHPSK